MDDLNDYVLFASVVEHGGFSAASRQTGIPKSRLSRRITELEGALNARLLQRTSRQFTVTPLGQRFYERCQAIIAAARSARELVSEMTARPVGGLKVSCPVTLSQYWLSKTLPAFLKLYPEISLSLTVTNRRVDIIEEEFDIALRVRKPPFEDADIVVRPLGTVLDKLVASPILFSGDTAPICLSELERWPLIGVRSSYPIDPELLKRVGSTPLKLDSKFDCDDLHTLREAALAGVGIAVLPKFICFEDLQSGRLQEVVPSCKLGSAQVQAAFPTRKGMLPAVRLFIDFLVNAFPRG
jgi:DNA-binding transcriptional LysR family regulator